MIPQWLCPHPANALLPHSADERVRAGTHVIRVSHHYFCALCRKEITLPHSELVGTVDEFLDVTEREVR